MPNSRIAFLIAGVPLTGVDVLPSADTTRRPSPRIVTRKLPDGRKDSAHGFGRPDATTSSLKLSDAGKRAARV